MIDKKREIEIERENEGRRGERMIDKKREIEIERENEGRRGERETDREIDKKK